VATHIKEGGQQPFTAAFGVMDERNVPLAFVLTPSKDWRDATPTLLALRHRYATWQSVLGVGGGRRT
jgi:hypothetical protein